MQQQSEELLNWQVPDVVSIDASKVPSPVLKRLIEEVKNENKGDVSAYNRSHNRHNRGR